MVIIYLRMMSNSPTILMGETGIGKTALVKFLALIMSYNFDCFDIHAGIEKDTIIKRIRDSEKKAIESNKKVVVFFDEINTNKNI